MKKQGVLIYDDVIGRMDIRFGPLDYYGGLHCGEQLKNEKVVFCQRKSLEKVAACEIKLLEKVVVCDILYADAEIVWRVARC